MGTIVVFSLASLGAATSQSILQLLFWRTVLGIGMGGEWASGAVLVSETWPAHLRNKAISIVQSGWAHRLHHGGGVRGADTRQLAVRQRGLAVAIPGWARTRVGDSLDSAQRARATKLDCASRGAEAACKSVSGDLRT